MNQNLKYLASSRQAFLALKKGKRRNICKNIVEDTYEYIF